MGWSDAGRPASQKYPRGLYPFASPQQVSTETPLLALIELGSIYCDLIVTVRNQDLTHAAAFYIDRSESGAVIDADRQTVNVPANVERRIEFRDVFSLYWAISAAGDPDNGFPAVNVSWQVVARWRG